MMILALMIGSVLALAPAEPYSEANLTVVITVAEAEQVRLDGRCVGALGAAAVDLEAETGYARMAEMRRMVVDHFPFNNYGPGGLPQRSENVQAAAQFYERAYRCNPGWDQRHHLNTAIAMIERQRKRIAEDERRPGSEDFTMLTEEEARLRKVLEELQTQQERLRPPPCEASRCPELGPGVGSRPPRGYRGRLMDLLSLRIEVGPTASLRVDEGVEPDPIDARVDTLEEYRPNAFVFSLSPGVRLLAGEKQRHVFGLGARYTLLAFKDQADASERVHQMALRMEYGIRVHLDWFSVHAGFEPGIQAHARKEYFGHVQLGGYGSLCTWGEALCLRVGGSRSVRPSQDTWLDVAQVTLGLDVFRVVDNVLRATEATP